MGGLSSARAEEGPARGGGSTADAGARRHRVVVVGGGFAGLETVRGLRRAPVEVTLVDRHNYHLFQPLLYQVATGALSPGEIAVPLRAIFRRYAHVRVVLGEAKRFCVDRRAVVVRTPHGTEHELPYDTLVVAGGSAYTYFGRDEWRVHAPDVKTLENALEVRRRILSAFEAAETEPSEAERAAWLTFVVVGAGPTGVELAGQIGELARDTLRRDFRAIDTARARILLVDLADRVIPGFSPRLSHRAAAALSSLGVTPLTGRRVIAIDGASVTLADAAGACERIPARTVIWAAGVVASETARALAEAAGAALDRAGRIAVGPDLALPGHPEVLALGDMAHVHDAHGNPVLLPGLAPVAMQQGRYAARAIRARLRGRPPGPFRYRDKGNLATIGRSKAVAELKGLELSGAVAWLTWLVVHLFYLIGFQNRVLVLIRWTFSFLTHGRGARLITTQAATPQPARAAPDPDPHAAGRR